MILSHILSIIAPYFLAKETKSLRGSRNHCSIEAQCNDLETCHSGECVPYMRDSTKYEGLPILNHDELHEHYWNCLDDIEISEEFFYNSRPRYMRTYVNELGISILYIRKTMVLLKWYVGMTIDDWDSHHTNAVLRIDTIPDTDLLVAFCPIN